MERSRFMFWPVAVIGASVLTLRSVLVRERHAVPEEDTSVPLKLPTGSKIESLPPVRTPSTLPLPSPG